jgi:hypothetical protein
MFFFGVSRVVLNKQYHNMCTPRHTPPGTTSLVTCTRTQFRTHTQAIVTQKAAIKILQTSTTSPIVGTVCSRIHLVIPSTGNLWVQMWKLSTTGNVSLLVLTWHFALGVSRFGFSENEKPNKMSKTSVLISNLWNEFCVFRDSVSCVEKWVSIWSILQHMQINSNSEDPSPTVMPHGTTARAVNPRHDGTCGHVP